jgi:DNA invertase Pin-like site-specific DNA recombinase
VRAAIYVRISRDISGESLGVTRQLEDCREVAEKAGWAVAEVYVDNDISATSGKPRPGYRKMLDDIKGGQLDAIVAWHSDRLYRRVVDLVELVDIVKEYDLQIATARSGEVDLTTPTGRLIAGMLAQIATYEGEAKSDRWKRSIRQRRETGEVHTMGPRLYGYERDGTIVPHEREHLEWAAGQILDGAALVRTTIGLNERGSRTTLGNEWNRAGLKKTLTNPRLAGMSVSGNQSSTPRRSRRYRPRSRSARALSRVDRGWHSCSDWRSAASAARCSGRVADTEVRARTLAPTGAPPSPAPSKAAAASSSQPNPSRRSSKPTHKNAPRTRASRRTSTNSAPAPASTHPKHSR